ncbi:MAG: hypothetical protein HON83_03170 [Candidatus Marinimicrobia bacterium]|jgi:hypothetical protein|nr:hypothetical protein [Candidatus Neomarinimicrobiota bacterium]MBT5235972.1 hypothetical protein [Candidatus Neomarinimicrobiota bacterium]
MDDILIVNIVWLLVGALAVWYADKRAYNEGIADAIIMHRTGQLTYSTYEDGDGTPMIDMEIKPNEE